MADKRISQLVDRGTVANNDVVPIVVSGATTTNKATISSIQTYMQGNLDLGVTSVGITLGSSGTDVSVSGSPITSSGNITINLPTASATNRGLLSAADWVTFNSKQDAGSFVTLDTTQTITAQKTFTTSGSSDTMIISHGSGSGFALDVLKAGNGEAIRVTKTSGTGNAMTISGGNFEAGTIVKTGGTSSQYLMADGSVSTLTNPVTGTGAAGQVAFWNGTNSQAGSNNLYWDNANVKLGIGISTPEATGLTVAGGGILVSLDSGAARKVLELYATSTGAKVSSTYVGASSYGSLEFLTSNIPRLTITAGGESTFSGALNGTSASFTGALEAGKTGGAVTSGDLLVDPTSLSANVYVGRLSSTSNDNTNFIVRNRIGTELFKVTGNTGAATFSSSVTLQNAGELRVYRSDNTRYGGFFTDGLAVHLTSSNDPIRISSADRTEFYNAGSERMRITSSGNVGIGTASPTNSKVHILKASSETAPNEQIRMQSTGGSVPSTWRLDVGANDGSFAITDNNVGERMRITSGGEVFIGCQSDPNASTNGIGLYPNGEIDISRSSGTTCIFNRNTTNGQIVDFRYNNTQVGSISTNSNSLPSDLNFKKDIVDISIGLNLITKLRPVHYRHKMDEDDEALSNGIIAQELEKALLDCGIEENSLLMLQYKPNEKEGESQYWVDYTKMIPVLIKAIQEQQSQIDSLKNQMQ